MDEIDFESDSFADIVAKDDRYDAHAYALLADVLAWLGKRNGEENGEENGGKKEGEENLGEHISGEDILEEFKERALDQYGPLAYTVLKEWGVKSCSDIGEMMCNMVESKRIVREESDSYEVFSEGYDFEEAFKHPYDV